MRRKRIAFDARYINDRYHGIGRFAFQLLKHLISIATDYDYIVYTGRLPDQRFNLEDLSDYSHVSLEPGPGLLYWPIEQLQWLRLLKRDEIDLIHSPYFNVPLCTGLPIIMTVHDMIFERFPQYMPSAWLRPYYQLLMRSGLKKSGKIITVSKNTARDLQYFYQFDRDKIIVVPEGVDDSFTPVKDSRRLEELRGRYNLTSPYILSVGARRPHKNFGRLITAFLAISGEFSYDLVLAGPIDSRFPDDIQSEIVRKGLMKRVKLLNWVPEVDLPVLYSLAECVVLPSILEGFGLPALEAMACGTPVIAANNSSFPEVVGDAGILVNPYDAIEIGNALRTLLSDAERRKRLSVDGLMRAKEYSWETAATRTLAIYRELIG